LKCGDHRVSLIQRKRDPVFLMVVVRNKEGNACKERSKENHQAEST